MSTANVSTTTMTTTMTTMMTTPIPIFNSDWFYYFFTINLPSFIYKILGIALNTVILIISAKKKREKEHTYRVVIVYISSMAITKDIGILYYFLFYSTLSGIFIYQWRLKGCNSNLKTMLFHDSICQARVSYSI